MKKHITMKKKQTIQKKNSYLNIKNINQQNCINQLFLNESFETKKQFEYMLKKKLSSYRMQDIM